MTLVICCGLAAFAAPCRAAESEEDVRKSREHYRKGEEAMTAGNFSDAYREFEAGYALVPRPLFLLNMAHSERRRGDIRKARALYKRYLLVEPESKFRATVESVIQEIDGAIAAEEQAAARANRPPVLTAPGPATAGATPAGVNVSAAAPGGAAGRPVYKQWWFWAAAGGTVAVVIVAGVLLSGGNSSYEKSGSLGTLGMK